MPWSVRVWKQCVFWYGVIPAPLIVKVYRSHAFIYDFSKALIRNNEIRESEVLVETYHYVVNDVNISRQK